MSKIVLGVIPVRFASTRFPGKPLVCIGGKPMMQHVFERASRARQLSGVIVATDDDGIAEVAHDSVQLPSATGTASGGQPQFIEPLARAAAALGVDGIFVEVYEDPSRALPDAANALRLDLLGPFWERVRRVASLNAREVQNV